MILTQVFLEWIFMSYYQRQEAEFQKEKDAKIDLEMLKKYQKKKQCNFLNKNMKD